MQAVGWGIFETIHDQLNPASMALSLKKYSSRYHGAIGMAWLNQVVANRQTISRYITGTIQTFVDAVIQPDATGQIIRVARRFDNANSPNNDKILNRVGFYHTDGEGFRIYMVLTETYKNELCKGFDQRTVTRVLLQAG